MSMRHGGFSDSADVSQVTLRRSESCDTPEERGSNPSSVVVYDMQAAPKAGTLKTAFTLFKAFCGGGLIYAPRSFALAGLVPAFCIYTMAAVLSIYSILVLLTTKKKLEARGYRVTHYMDVARITLGPTGYSLLGGAITTSQLGFGCTYFIYMGKYVQTSVRQFTNCDQSPEAWEPMLYVLPVFYGLALLRRVKCLAWPSLMGTLCIFTVLTYLLAYDGGQLEKHGTAQDWQLVGSSSGILMTLGTACYAFEGTVLVLPVQSSMKDPSKFPIILIGAVLTDLIVLVSMGSVHYLVNGGNTGMVAIENLPLSNAGSKVVTIAVTFITIVTYPLCMYPATAAFEGWLGFRAEKSGRKWSKNFVRLVLVLFTFFVAATCAELLDYFLSIVGGLCCVPIALFFPARMAYNVLGWGSPDNPDAPGPTVQPDDPVMSEKYEEDEDGVVVPLSVAGEGIRSGNLSFGTKPSGSLDGSVNEPLFPREEGAIVTACIPVTSETLAQENDDDDTNSSSCCCYRLLAIDPSQRTLMMVMTVGLCAGLVSTAMSAYSLKHPDTDPVTEDMFCGNVNVTSTHSF